MKLNVSDLKSFLSRIQIGKEMITEVPIRIRGNLLHVLTTNENKQVIIRGSMELPEQYPNMEFSFPKLKDILDSLKDFSGEVVFQLQNGFATFMDSEKEYKTEVIQSSLYESIEKVAKFESLDEFNHKVTIAGQEFIFNDSIEFNGSDMVKAMKKCDVSKSPFYSLSQESGRLTLTSDSKTSSMKVNLNLEPFKEDKNTFLVEFYREIFKNNSEKVRLFIPSRSSPAYLDTLGDKSRIQFLIAPKE